MFDKLTGSYAQTHFIHADLTMDPNMDSATTSSGTSTDSFTTTSSLADFTTKQTEEPLVASDSTDFRYKFHHAIVASYM